MVTTTENKLIIEVEHALPKELYSDLKLAIVNFLKLKSSARLTMEEYQDTKITMLLLLQALVED